MLEARIWCIRVLCLQREMVEQMPAPKIRLCLRNDLGSFHSLSIPERRAILTAISFSSFRLDKMTYDCDPDALFITGIGRVLVIRRETQILVRGCCPVNIPLPSADLVRP